MFKANNIYPSWYELLQRYFEGGAVVDWIRCITELVMSYSFEHTLKISAGQPVLGYFVGGRWESDLHWYVLTLVHWCTQKSRIISPTCLSLSLDTSVDRCSMFHIAMLLETLIGPQLHYWIWYFKECWLNCPPFNAEKANQTPTIGLHTAVCMLKADML